MYACMHGCMQACMHVCMYACVYVCTVCVYVCMYVCIYVCASDDPLLPATVFKTDYVVRRGSSVFVASTCSFWTIHPYTNVGVLQPLESRCIPGTWVNPGFRGHLGSGRHAGFTQDAGSTRVRVQVPRSKRSLILDVAGPNN